MDERSFYTEKEEVRKAQLVCPSCHKDFEFPVRWKVCRKKKELPRGASPEDRKKFDHATSYMVRLDDLVACYKCRKRFEPARRAARARPSRPRPACAAGSAGGTAPTASGRRLRPRV